MTKYTIARWIVARWKALMPLLVAAVSEALNQGFDLNTPAGWKLLVLAVASSLLVHQVPNKGA